MFVQLVGQAHRAAVDWVEDVVREEKIDCDFTRLDGYLYPHDSSSSTYRTLEKELQASINAGLPHRRVPFIRNSDMKFYVGDNLKGIVWWSML